jgi:hypothetical protein
MMAEYLAKVHRMEKFFDGFEVQYVPRLDNRDADHLAWIASSKASTPPDVIVERLFKLSVKLEESTSQAELVLMIIDEPAQQPVDDWMSLIRAYLNNKSPSDVTIPQIFTRVRGPLAASAHEVGTAQVRVLIGCVFVEIVIESETYHICKAVLLTI